MTEVEVLKAIKLRYKELREEIGLKQIDFAKKYDIDRQQLNNWESLSSTRGVSIYTINSFCDNIGISLKDFFNSPLFENNDRNVK